MNASIYNIYMIAEFLGSADLFQHSLSVVSKAGKGGGPVWGEEGLRCACANS